MDLVLPTTNSSYDKIKEKNDKNIEKWNKDNSGGGVVLATLGGKALNASWIPCFHAGKGECTHALAQLRSQGV
eukprot:2526623-Amphidinium_carterae.1